MKSKIYLSFLVLITFVASSCQKQPTASFTSDKSEYISGETIKLTNTSVDGSSYKWTWPDGKTTTAKDLEYKLDPKGADRSITFKLEVLSKNGKKKDETSKSINVKAGKGDVTFWQKTGSGFGITTVTVNGSNSTITSEYASSPSCGASGSATFSNLKVGSYNYTATDGTSEWSGSFSIESNGFCLTLELY